MSIPELPMTRLLVGTDPDTLLLALVREKFRISRRVTFKLYGRSNANVFSHCRLELLALCRAVRALRAAPEAAWFKRRHYDREPSTDVLGVIELMIEERPRRTNVFVKRWLNTFDGSAP